MTTTAEIEDELKRRNCAIVEDHGCFALVYPYGYENRKRAHDLQATSYSAALREAWEWLNPEQHISDRIEIIQQTVARDFGVMADEIREGGRPEPLATARRIAMALSRELTPATVMFVGELFRREHHTVTHAERSIADQCATDTRFAARVGALRAACLAAFSKNKTRAA